MIGSNRSLQPELLNLHQENDKSKPNPSRSRKGNFHYKTEYEFDAGVGLSEEVVRYISDVKKEDEWVKDFRLKALKTFEKKRMPTHWASKIGKYQFYVSVLFVKRPNASRTWEEVPDEIKQTFERFEIPEQERKFLAGVEAQFDSEAAYSRMKDDLSDKGVIFVGSTEGLKEYPEIFKSGW